MGDDLNRLPPLGSREFLQDREPMVPDGLTTRDVFIADRGRFFPCALRPLARRGRPDGIDHSLDCPAKIDRRRTCRDQIFCSALQRVVTRIVCQRDRYRVRGGRAD